MYILKTHFNSIYSIIDKLRYYMQNKFIQNSKKKYYFPQFKHFFILLGKNGPFNVLYTTLREKRMYITRYYFRVSGLLIYDRN